LQLDEHLLADFINGLAHKPVLEKHRFSLAAPVVVYERLDELVPDLKADFWKAYRQRFPNGSGTVRLSNVAVAPDGTMAMVYVGAQSAGLAGEGRIYILERAAEGWKIVYSITLWVS